MNPGATPENDPDARIPPAQEEIPAPASDDGWEEVEPLRVGSGTPPGRIRVWSLVLEARGIEHRIRHRGGRSALFVLCAHRPRADDEIRRYEVENLSWPPAAPPAAPTVENFRSTFAVLAALGLFHDLTFQPPGRVFGISVAWQELGAMDAGRALQGEWWRAVTALTLHADGLHLAGNLVLGGVLFAQLNRQLGVGPGMALTLTAGALGNLTNALVREPSHRSIGASTAVFGALGALVARATWGSAHHDWRRWVVPLGAGGGLMALVGVGGADTDYLAHLFGFGWGLVAGLFTQWPRPLRRAPGWKASTLAGVAALSSVAVAWAWAILQG